MNLLVGERISKSGLLKPSRFPASGSVPLFAWLLLAVAFVWRAGYAYGVSDHDEMLPQLLHQLDPSLFARDWFVLDQVERFNVRAYFLLLLRGLSLLMPVPAAVALVFVAAWSSIVYGIYRFAHTLTPSRAAALAATFAVVLITRRWTLGGNVLTYQMLVPELLGWAFVIHAVRLYTVDQRGSPAILLGIGTLFHPLAGMLTALALGLVGLMDLVLDRQWRPRRLSTLVRFGIVYLIVALPMLAPLVQHQLAEPAVADGGLSTFYLLAELRLPHHHMLLSFPPADLIRMALLAVAGVAGYAWLRRLGWPHHHRFAGRFLLVIGALCIVAAVFTEAVPVLPVAKLQLFKLTVLGSLVLTCLAVGALVTALPAGIRASLEGALEYRQLGLAVAVALAVATGVLAASGVGRPGAMVQPLAHERSDLARVEQWARGQTDRDALFVVPPTMDSFRTLARRSIVVNYKSVPFEADGLREWLARMQAVAPAPLPQRGTGFALALDSAYYASGAEDWARIASLFAPDFVITDASRMAAPASDEVAFAAGRWVVYRMNR
jgi:hypothetical protein